MLFLLLLFVYCYTWRCYSSEVYGEICAHGTCRKGICTCDAGWLGEKCDIADGATCEGGCGNFGVCSDGKCTCEPFNFGKTCSEKIGPGFEVMTSKVVRIPYAINKDLLDEKYTKESFDCSSIILNSNEVFGSYPNTNCHFDCEDKKYEEEKHMEWGDDKEKWEKHHHKKPSKPHHAALVDKKKIKKDVDCNKPNKKKPHHKKEKEEFKLDCDTTMFLVLKMENTPMGFFEKNNELVKIHPITGEQGEEDLFYMTPTKPVQPQEPKREHASGCIAFMFFFFYLLQMCCVFGFCFIVFCVVCIIPFALVTIGCLLCCICRKKCRHCHGGCGVTRAPRGFNRLHDEPVGTPPPVIQSVPQIIPQMIPQQHFQTVNENIKTDEVPVNREDNVILHYPINTLRKENAIN